MSGYDTQMTVKACGLLLFLSSLSILLWVFLLNPTSSYRSVCHHISLSSMILASLNELIIHFQLMHKLKQVRILE